MISAAKKYPREAWGLGDSVEGVQGLYGLDLDPQLHVFVGIRQILAIGAPARGPGEACADTADAFWGIARGRHQGLGLGAGVDHGNQQVVRANVQVALDER